MSVIMVPPKCKTSVYVDICLLLRFSKNFYNIVCFCSFLCCEKICVVFSKDYFYSLISTKNNRSNLMLKLFSKRFIFMTQKCIQNFKCWRPKNFIRIPIFGNVQIHGVFATFGIPHCVYPMQKNIPESKSTL